MTAYMYSQQADMMAANSYHAMNLYGVEALVILAIIFGTIIAVQLRPRGSE